LILTVSNIIVKIVSAFYIIVLTRLITSEGMGYLNSAYTIYTVMFIVATAGLPITISRMIATSNALGRNHEPEKILKIAMSVYLTISAVVTLLVFFGAKEIADFINNSSAQLAFKVMAPSIIIISGISALKGYFQGFNNMKPTAVTNIIESVVKLLAGVGIAWYLLSKGYGKPIIAAGAIAGVTIGSLICGIYIVIVFLLRKKSVKISSYLSTTASRPSRVILKEFIFTAAPILLGSLTANISNVIDLIIIMKRLGYSGLAENMANTLYGSYTSMAVTFFNMPTLIISAIATTILPAMAAAYAVKNTKRIKSSVDYALKSTSILAVPMALGMSVMAGPVLNLLFDNDPFGVSVAVPLLNILGVAVIWLSIGTVSNSMMQAIGKPIIPVYNILIGGAIKFISNFILIGIPSVRILGAPISTNLCYFTIMVLNIFWIKKYTGVMPNIKDIFIKPFFAAAACAATAYGTYFYLGRIVGYKLSTLVGIAFGGIIYLILLLLLKGLTKDEIYLLPLGKKLAKILEKKGKIV
jgi:stage V sporulation protein B